MAQRPKTEKRANKPRTAAKGEAPPLPPAKRFPVIGIGTSAGGLEALEMFLRHVPRDTGMAFVVIQHLDPLHKGMLPELLRRFTSMPVHEVKKALKVDSDCVYVIPPNKDLLLEKGVLLPLAPLMPRGLRLPIDRFFRSLADECREFGVGVILSGMGSDGALGLRQIKEKAGLIVVQEPAEAASDGMPRSAIATGLVDIVATACDLPVRIQAYFRRSGLPLAAIANVDEQQRADMDKVLSLLRARSGRDFSQYKKSSVYRRIDRRMSIHQLEKVEAYVRYVREHPEELDLLFKELLIGVTSFFRDQQAWEYIKTKVFPALLAQHPAGGALRAWVSACSTGEEAYSLAILFREALDELKPQVPFTIQIFATDLDVDAIDKARKGLYSGNIQADLGARRLARFFHEEGTGYRVRGEIREMVTFAPQDILLDPPFTKLDFLFCRNLLIYLGPPLQKKLIGLFHYSLNPGAVLFLGTAETVGSDNQMFTAMDSKIRLFRRRDMLGRGGAVDFPTGRFPIILNSNEDVKISSPTPNLGSLVEQMLLQRICPAAVLVNAAGDILYISGRTGKYLEPASGQANWNIHAMARDGLRGELSAAMHHASRHKEAVLLGGLVVGINGSSQTIDVSVQALDEPAPLRGMLLIVFNDVEAAAVPTKSAGSRKGTYSRKVAEMEVAVSRAREESRRLYEDMQTTQEELKSANEELQSINEELTTSKEEMQSMNEELQTVNAELQSKVDELTRTSNDMKNLLDSTDIATIFLDSALHLRRFTSHATSIFKFIPGDVSRPLSDIVTQLDYPELEHDVQQVLRTLVFCEKQVTAAGNRWFKVRIMPYRTAENVIDGVVITFSNITEQKMVESALRKKLDTRSTAPPGPQ